MISADQLLDIEYWVYIGMIVVFIILVAPFAISHIPFIGNYFGDYNERERTLESQIRKERQRNLERLTIPQSMKWEDKFVGFEDGDWKL